MDVFEYLIESLITAWILTWFDVDKIFIDVIQPLTKVEITTSHFYFVFACIGIVYGLFSGMK